MAVAVGKVVGANGKSNLMFGRKDGEDRKLWGRRNVRAMASVSCGKLKEEYKLLRLKPNSTEKEFKQAYRRLALQYHPYVCKGENYGVMFHKINEAYQIVMSALMEVNEEEEYYGDEGYMGFGKWEEWMGFEGGIPSRDHSNHIIYYGDDWEEWMGFEGGCPSTNYSNHINYDT
ncbi:chaperone protein dnaJ 8, chloroplastic-like [Cryptomeria japonica]|uniref:chaperone protein dnaJ 8, chloroplastic-like n=1 Tax=Cryptomeria japonica TaxID=3369 RepID=UPI0025ACE3A1|nr:chaperone protein dnaJ 8, chloroplastic-like [Cryptomeria japonica]